MIDNYDLKINALLRMLCPIELAHEILPVCEIEANQVKLSQTAKFITELAKLKSEGIGGA